MNIGIDLGTTNTVVSWMNIFGSIEFLKFDDDSVMLPSCIYSEKGIIYTGACAVRQSSKNLKNFVCDSKVYMDDKQKIWCLDGVRMRPWDVAFEILKKVRSTLREQFPDEKDFNAVLTVPAKFGEDQIRKTANALKRAGIGLIEIIKEPVAAVLAYADESFRAGDIIYVIDFGGGTIDTALVKYSSPDNLAVLAAEGDRHLGGKDLDDVISKMIFDKLRGCSGQDISDDSTAWGVSRRSLRQHVRILSGKLKNDLYKKVRAGNDEPVTLTDGKLCCICEHGDTCEDDGKFSISITYDEFAAAADDIFERLESIISGENSVFSEGTYDIHDVSHVIFAGGMCTDIYLEQLVRSVFENKDIITACDEEEDQEYLTVIARGAGIKAGDEHIHIVNKLLNSIGVMCTHSDGSCFIDPVIECGDDIDDNFSSTHIYTNSGRFETELSFEICEYSGNPDDLEGTQYRKLGVFVFNDITPADTGRQRIEAVFTFDAKGLMSISAKDLNNGRKISVQLEI